MLYSPFILAVVLSLLNWFAEQLGPRVEKHHANLLSYSAGLALAYVFVFLLPEIVDGSRSTLGNSVYYFLLAGFACFHFAEKFVYQHVRNKREQLKELGEVHALGFFADHFLLGMVLYYSRLAIEGSWQGLLVFVPLALHTVSSSLAMSHLHERFRERQGITLLLSLAPVVGAMAAYGLNPETIAHYGLFAFAVGALLYIVVRDMLPEGRKGDSRLFALGALTAMALGFAAGWLPK